MNKPRVHVQAFLVVVTLLISAAATDADDVSSQTNHTIDWRRADQLKKVIEYLPVFTRSVVVVRTPFRIPRDAPDNEMDIKEWRASYNYLAVSGASRFGLPILKDGKYYQRLAGHEVAFVVQAATRTAPPPAVETATSQSSAKADFRFHGCQLVAFSRPLGKAGDKMFDALRIDADKVERFDGCEVAVFKHTERRSYFIARPTTNLLVAATEKKYLQSVLHRIAGKSKRKSTLLKDSIWKHINASAEVFAVGPPVFIASQKGKNAVFMFSSKTWPIVKIRHMAKKSDLLQLRQHWTLEDPRVPATARVVSPGVIDVTVPEGRHLPHVLHLSSILGYSLFGDRLSK